MQKNLVSVIIMAAGHSSRMGIPKPFLQYRNRFWIEEIIEGYQSAGIASILIISTSPIIEDERIQNLLTNYTNITVQTNQRPDLGRSYSIHQAAMHVVSDHDYFIHNIDNPCPSKVVIEQMIAALKSGSQYVIPMVGERTAHPVLVSKDILTYLRDLTHLDWTLKDLLQRFSKAVVCTNDTRLLYNLNTPDDWKQFLLHTFAT